VAKYGASGLGTDGKGSSIRVNGGGVDMDDMLMSGGDTPPWRDVQTIAVEILQKRG